MNDFLVSVVMNCHNGDEFLRESIDSVYRQTYKNWEIIFIDNFSNDLSPEIVKEYDHNIKYFRTDHLMNLGDARNLALSYCNGDLVSFLDVDDIWIENKLTIQIQSLIETKCEIAYSSYCYINKNGRFKKNIYTKYNTEDNLLKNISRYEVNFQSLIFKRNILDDSVISFDSKLNLTEDMDFFYRLSLNKKVCVIRKVLCKTRVHEKQTSRISYYNWFKEFRYCYFKLRKLTSLDKKYKNSLKKYLAKILYYKARSVVSGEIIATKHKILRPVIKINYKYILLYLLSYFPNKICSIFLYFKVF